MKTMIVVEKADEDTRDTSFKIMHKIEEKWGLHYSYEEIVNAVATLDNVIRDDIQIDFKYYYKNGSTHYLITDLGKK